MDEKVFLEQCHIFLEQQTAVEWNWTLKAVDGHHYLELVVQSQCCVSAPQQIDDQSEIFSQVVVIQEDDGCSLSVPASSETRIYHIVHSLTYNSPVLYFTAHCADGSLVSLEDVVGRLPVAERKRRWSVVSQEMHPLLHQPFYFIHPCVTPVIMDQLQTRSLFTWLTSVAHLVDLHVPLPVPTNEQE